MFVIAAASTQALQLDTKIGRMRSWPRNTFETCLGSGGTDVRHAIRSLLGDTSQGF